MTLFKIVAIPKLRPTVKGWKNLNVKAHKEARTTTDCFEAVVLSVSDKTSRIMGSLTNGALNSWFLIADKIYCLV